MLAASLYFAQGLYENSMTRKLARQATLKFGLSCTSSSSSYWTIFDNFRLYYYGTPNEDVNGIRNVEAATNAGQGARQGIYSFNGTLVSRDTSRASSLPKGLYIVDGKKVIIK